MSNTEEKLLRAEKLLSAVWKIGAFIVVICTTLVAVMVWLMSDFVRYSDDIGIKVLLSRNGVHVPVSLNTCTTDNATCQCEGEGTECMAQRSLRFRTDGIQDTVVFKLEPMNASRGILNGVLK